MFLLVEHIKKHYLQELEQIFKDKKIEIKRNMLGQKDK